MNNDPSVNNHISGAQIGGNFIGGDCTTNHYHQRPAPEPRGFIVTHTSDIKPTSHFMGRKSELADLRTNAEEGRKSILVSGMGGIGKTHICRQLFKEYHERHLRKESLPFQHIGYIQYDGNMDSSLVSCLIYPKPADQAAQVEAAWHELSLLADKGLLLFVDNVSNSIGGDPSLLKLCSLPSPVILTSRLKYFDSQNAFELYPIDSLPLEECRKLYLKITGDTPDHQQALDEILDIRAARHTLTVELLARTAASNEWDILTLLDKLKSNGFQLTYEDGDQTVALMDAYEKLFILSALNDAEINILEAFSLFPYLPLHKDTCTAWLLPDAGEKASGSIFQKLYRKGWLQYERNLGYQMHPVLSHFIFEYKKPTWKPHQGLLVSCHHAMTIPQNGDISLCRKYLPYIESLNNKLQTTEQPEFAIFFSTFAYLLNYLAEFNKAIHYWKKALIINSHVFGKKSQQTVLTINNLAASYLNKGNHKKASALIHKSLKHTIRLLGMQHPETAHCFQNLASIYMHTRKFSRAIPLYKAALHIYISIQGNMNPHTALCCSNLANAYNHIGEYKKSIRFFKNAIRVRLFQFGKNHLQTAASIHNLGGVYDNLQEYEKALRLYKIALRIRLKFWKTNHPDTAFSLHNIAGAYEKMGNLNKAFPLYKKALRICYRILGTHHPTTILFGTHTLYCHYKILQIESSFEMWLLERFSAESD